MLLSDVYNMLAYGELRELAIGGSTIAAQTNGVKEIDYKRLLPHVQLGLTSLHTKCALKEGRLLVPLVPSKVVYILATDHDAPVGWPDNLLLIERVYGVLDGKEKELTLDDLEDPASIRKTQANVLMIPSDPELAPWLKETTQLDVRYRADHPIIDPYLANQAPFAQEIDLPATHLEALCYFVASRLYNPIGMVPGALHQGNNYALKYEALVAQLNSLGMHQETIPTNNRLRQNDWV